MIQIVKIHGFRIRNHKKKKEVSNLKLLKFKSLVRNQRKLIKQKMSRRRKLKKIRK